MHVCVYTRSIYNYFWMIIANICWVCAYSVLSTLHVLTLLIFLTTQWDRCNYYGHFFRWENWGTQQSCNWLKFTQLISGRFVLWTLVWWTAGFPGGSACKQSACNAGDLGSIPGSGTSPGEGNGLPSPVFLPGEFHGQRSLVGYSPWGRRVGCD